MNDVVKTGEPDLMELAKEIYVRHTKIVSAKKELVQRAIELASC